MTLDWSRTIRGLFQNFEEGGMNFREMLKVAWLAFRGNLRFVDTPPPEVQQPKKKRPDGRKRVRRG